MSFGDIHVDRVAPELRDRIPFGCSVDCDDRECTLRLEGRRILGIVGGEDSLRDDPVWSSACHLHNGGGSYIGLERQ